MFAKRVHQLKGLASIDLKSISVFQMPQGNFFIFMVRG